MDTPERIVAEREANERDNLRKRRDVERDKLAPEINHVISLFLAMQAERGYPAAQYGVEHSRISWQGEEKLSWKVFTRRHKGTRELHLLSTGILVEASREGGLHYKEYSYDHNTTTQMLLGALQDMAELPVEIIDDSDPEIASLIRAGLTALANAKERSYTACSTTVIENGRKLTEWEVVDSPGDGNNTRAYLLSDGRFICEYIGLSSARRAMIINWLKEFAKGQPSRPVRNYQFPEY